MNLSMKQKQNHGHREQTGGCQGGGVGGGMERRLGLADVSFNMQNKQQGPTVQHRELYSIYYEKP